MPGFHFPMLLLVLLGFATTSTAATSYAVGDAAGWDISADLSSWPAGKTFYVGDVLLFRYSSYHSLHEVDKAGYANCSTARTVVSGTNGNTSVALTSPGDKYFICGVLLHCLSGMKLHLNTSVALPAGAPAPPAGAPAPPAGAPAVQQEQLRPADVGAPARKGSGGGGFHLSAAPRGFGAMACSCSVLMFSFSLLASSFS